MHFAIPDFRPHRTPEPPAEVRVVAQIDVTWNRRVFKAPPLEVKTPGPSAPAFADDLRWSFRRERRD